jgi:hypothetical protein
MGSVVRTAVVALAIAATSPVVAEDGRYFARLSTVPIDLSTEATISGSGAVMGLLNGRELTLDGTFGGMKGAATAARIHLSPLTGVRGPAVLDLDVADAAEGALSATVELSRAQIQALAEGRLYIQIDSEAAPDGNLWGWLLP